MKFVNAYKAIIYGRSGIPKKYKWVAVENDGSIWLYENEPVLNKEGEYWGRNGGRTDCLFSDFRAITVSNWDKLCFKL